MIGHIFMTAFVGVVVSGSVSAADTLGHASHTFGSRS